MNESWELEAREEQLTAFESTSNIDENRPIRRSGKPCHDKTLPPIKQAAAGVSQPFDQSSGENATVKERADSLARARSFTLAFRPATKQ